MKSSNWVNLYILIQEFGSKCLNLGSQMRKRKQS
jgi:hypothetical protein